MKDNSSFLVAWFVLQKAISWLIFEEKMINKLKYKYLFAAIIKGKFSCMAACLSFLRVPCSITLFILHLLQLHRKIAAPTCSSWYPCPCFNGQHRYKPVPLPYISVLRLGKRSSATDYTCMYYRQLIARDLRLQLCYKGRHPRND